ncbi:MAG: HAMP domain-containing histidine kinase [Lachnospiraceae bacterium]|nr:HAMP domain-containing histidine kinase [Lachnospiraceae bacterium]
MKSNREEAWKQGGPGDERSGSRAAGILAVLLVLALAAGAVYASYPFAYRKYEERAADSEDDRYLANQIYRGNMVLYWELQEELHKENLEPSEVFLPGYGQETERTDSSKEQGGAQTDSGKEQEGAQTEEAGGQKSAPAVSTGEQENFQEDSDESYMRRIMNERLYAWEAYLAGQLSNLYYCMIDHETGSKVSNYEDLAELVSIKTEKDLGAKKEQYRYVVRMNLDEAGNPSIAFLYGGASAEFLSFYKYNSFENNIWNEAGVYHFGPDYKEALTLPSDVTVIYAIPMQFAASDELSYYFGYSGARDYVNASIETVVAAAYLFAGICAVLLPFLRRLRLGEGLAGRIPGEAAGLLLILAIGMFDSVVSLGCTTAIGRLGEELSGIGFTGFSAEWFGFLVNMGFMMLVFGAEFLAVLSLREILIHPIQYLKKTLLARFLTLIGRKMKKAYRALLDIDLTDPTNKAILKIVLINFCALALMCSIWVFGIGVLAAYSILLFLLLKKYAGDIKQKYAILLKATRQMSEGNLNVVIEEDLGLFNPLKCELEEIQTGFKKAVDEEVKSQNMKTELITNVSHDLKTPLTAIITYIDLMKDPNLSEEERRQYLGTLDRKAARLKNLIEDLFEVSKASSRNVTLTLVDVDLCALLKQIEFELSDKMEESGVEFRFRLPEEKAVLRLDSQKTYRIFENLIINITKYALPGTRAYVDLSDLGDRVMVVLKNISKDELDFDTSEITERFVRGDKSRNTEGSGLGLAIVKSFTELQGGTFEILADGDLFKAVVWFWK